MGLTRYYNLPVPVTALTIMPQIFLITVCVIDIRKYNNANYFNLMLLAILIWVAYVILQLINRTCLLPISFNSWFMNFMFYGLSFILAYFLITTLIRSYSNIMLFIKFWAFLTIIANFWAWRQQNIGWDETEWAWLMSGASRTHIIGGSIRYFSFFSDAANYGCSIAASAIAFSMILYAFGAFSFRYSASSM